MSPGSRRQTRARHGISALITCALAGAGCNDLERGPASILGPETDDIAPRFALSGGQWSVETIKVGRDHACALEADGEAYCWGSNQYGQLGDGSTSNRRVPTRVVRGHQFVEIDAFTAHTCALTAAGEAYCWGLNSVGQLGDGTNTNRDAPTPVAGGHSFAAISTGAAHTCALDEDGAAWCWGEVDEGRLGSGAVADANVPTAVVDGHAFVSIEAGDTRTCALKADGSAYCWGWNGDLQVVHWSPVLRASPVPFKSISASEFFTCGIGTDDSAFCWGPIEPWFNKLGSDLPFEVEGPELVSLSDDGRLCGLDTGGDIHCWRWDEQLIAHSVTSGAAFETFSGSATVLSTGAIRTDMENLCGLDAGGFAYCWGDNEFGQIGDGTITDHSQPTPVLAPGSSPRAALVVLDLAVTGRTTSSVTLTWTQVDDGTGEPASYRMKYGLPFISWPSATVGCDRSIEGTAIGAPISCTVDGLTANTTYDFQLVAYRMVNGVWVDAEYSNVATAQTDAGTTPNTVVGDLAVVDVGNSTLTVQWTTVDDGTGNPARYRVKYDSPITVWRDAITGCNVLNSAIGVNAECTIIDLDPAVTYDVQLMSYRVENGAWMDAEYSNLVTATTGGSPGDPSGVDDLVVVGVTSSTLSLEWTEVDDGTGAPAWYRVKYATRIGNWSNATIGCDRSIEGDQIGARIGCTIEGLTPLTRYEVQLMSYRTVDGVWMDAQFSNLVAGATTSGS